MRKALFLDRDGVINIKKNYVYKIKDFIIRDEIYDICLLAKKLDFLIIIVTNQAGIGRGIFSLKEFLKITDYMINKFKEKGIGIDSVYFCPYHPTNGKGCFLRDSYLRKPNPGMLLKAKKEFDIDFEKSLMIGDMKTDLLAAQNAKLKIYINAKSNYWKKESLDALSRL